MEQKMAEQKALLSPDELATYLGCGRTYAFGLIRTGEIPSFKLGRMRKVKRSDADAFIERQAAASRDGAD